MRSKINDTKLTLFNNVFFLPLNKRRCVILKFNEFSNYILYMNTSYHAFIKRLAARDQIILKHTNKQIDSMHFLLDNRIMNGLTN